jgi:phenylpyruvate tautomerase PptA (4-oxalocrotonate tautomerase family)
VPHISIKHFPHDLDTEERSGLVLAITNAVKAAFSCDEGVVSIAIEPVAQDAWNERVYVPEILNAKGTLAKAPNY